MRAQQVEGTNKLQRVLRGLGKRGQDLLILLHDLGSVVGRGAATEDREHAVMRRLEGHPPQLA